MKITNLFDKLRPPVAWINRKMGNPTDVEEWERYREWEYAQANDDAIWAAERDPDRLVEAIDLREIDPPAAFRAFLTMAQQGSVFSMNDVAVSFLAGEGIAADVAQAEFWFRQSFVRGSQRALLGLGAVLSRRGDFDGAEAVFQVGADQDWVPAFYRLASTRLARSNTRQTLGEVRPLLERAAAGGSAMAKWRLYRNMALGRYGPREIGRGWKLFLQSNDENLAAHEKSKVARKESA